MEAERDVALLENVLTVAQMLLAHPTRFPGSADDLLELGDEIDLARLGDSKVIGAEVGMLAQALIEIQRARDARDTKRAARWTDIARVLRSHVSTDLARATAAGLDQHKP